MKNTPKMIALASIDEADRLAAVRRYDILDTPPDGSFDRITALAADIFSVPIAIISLVDHDRIWFKSHHGLDASEIDREPGLCASAILQADPWVFTDAKHDVRALANPLVAGEFGLRFYAGVPLRTSDGFNLGTLCVIAHEPRIASEQQIERLKNLASVVMDQMELRLSARQTVTELTQAVRRGKLMAREIDHRVMNSLQLVSGLLNIQGRMVGNSETAGVLNAAASRVSAIARIHQHIYLSDNIETTEFGAYLKRLCDDLSKMLRLPSRGEIAIKSIEAEIPNERVVALGLLVNELVMNAIKHGIGKISVSLEHSGEGDYLLSVSDEGTSFKTDFDPKHASGLGMRVISSLVEQLGGKLNVISKPGTTFLVKMPRETGAQRSLV